MLRAFQFRWRPRGAARGTGARLDRAGLLVGLCASSLLFAAVACQTLPFKEATPTAGGAAQPAIPASTLASASTSVVWAKVPYCTCLTGIATANVSAALKDAHLAGTVKEHYPTGGWLYFVVAFDPKGASREQIAAAITAGGGQVVAGPP